MFLRSVLNKYKILQLFFRVFYICFSIFVVLTCKSPEKGGNQDTTPPEVENSQIEVYRIFENSLSLRWERGIDAITSNDDVAHEVYISFTGNIDTLENIKKNGTLVKGITTITTSNKQNQIESLQPLHFEGKHTHQTLEVLELLKNTTYFFNVITSDLKGNQRAYTMVSETTASQTILSLPIFTPVPGTFTSDQTITLTHAEPGTTIYYTKDGIIEPSTDFSPYTSPILIAGDETTLTIKALASKYFYPTSDVITGTYNILYNQVAVPVFLPIADTYDATTAVTITTETLGASIYYTVEGSEPSSDSMLYSGSPIQISGNGTSTTIKAIALKNDMDSSESLSGTYNISYPSVASPTFSDGEGTYNNYKPCVTLSATTTGATIYYTTDGSPPTTSSTAYTVPILVSVSTDILAFATKADMTDSQPASASYILTGVPVGTCP